MPPSKTAVHESIHATLAAFLGCEIGHLFVYPHGQARLMLPPVGSTEALQTALVSCLGVQDPSAEDRAITLPYRRDHFLAYGAISLERQKRLAKQRAALLLLDPDVHQALDALATALDAKCWLSGPAATAILEPYMRTYRRKRQQAHATVLLDEVAVLQARRRASQTSYSHSAFWCAEPQWFSRALAEAPGMEARTRPDRPPYTRIPGAGGDIAVIELNGPMSKSGNLLTLLFGGTITTQTRMALRQAVADEKVRAILLAIDSPGGEFSGTPELAEDVARLTRVKPIHAVIADIGASAAYYVASQATSISVNSTGEVGSIGVVATLVDESKRGERLGVSTIIISTGSYKGVGTPGAQITPEQLDYFQSRINGLGKFFIDAVARGRKVSTTHVKREWADGRVYLGSTAVAMGLVDRVETFEQALSRLATGKG